MLYFILKLKKTREVKMAKELPYFQFEPAEYLTKDISFCSMSAQGLFINLCSYYWQRECKLTKDQLLRRLNHPNELQELIYENVISVNENVISVKFLDEQYKKATNRSNINKINGSKGGRPKKQNQNKSELKPNKNQNKSELKGIREDKIIKDKIKEDENILSDFKKSLQPFLDKYGKEMLNDFYLYWTEKGEKEKKYRWQKQKTWDLSRRLQRWDKNNYGNKPKKDPKQMTIAEKKALLPKLTF